MAATNLDVGKVPLGVRFGGVLLDTLLASFTFYIGWLAWFAVVSWKGKSPGKQLLGMVVLDYKSGRVASLWQLWLRDVVIRMVAPFALLIIVVEAADSSPAAHEGGPLYYVLLMAGYYTAAAIAILISKDGRAPWDYLARTVVRREAPSKREQVSVDQ